MTEVDCQLLNPCESEGFGVSGEGVPLHAIATGGGQIFPFEPFARRSGIPTHDWGWASMGAGSGAASMLGAGSAASVCGLVLQSDVGVPLRHLYVGVPRQQRTRE